MSGARNLEAPWRAADTVSACTQGAKWLLVAGIRFYQAVLSPLMPVGCKFYPSCSHYAVEAVTRHGALRGTRLAAARLWRCRPFTAGGFDPVPDPEPEFPEPTAGSLNARKEACG